VGRRPAHRGAVLPRACNEERPLPYARRPCDGPAHRGRPWIRAAKTTDGYYTGERKAARRRASAAKVEARALLTLQSAAARAARTHTLLTLQLADAHPADVIAPHRLPLPDAATPKRKARRSGKSDAESANGR